MGNIFSGSEIVELGIQIENNGKDFYEALISQTKNHRAKEIFQYLSQEEGKHIAVFKKILDSVHKYEPPESYPGEYFAYMAALASDCVFTQKDKGIEMARNVSSDKEAVEMGIGFEKDSILLYQGMKRVVPEYDHKTVEELVAQEQMHLRQLSDLKKNL